MCLETAKEDYNYPFGKMVDTHTYLYEEYHPMEKERLGVYVDVFPLDGLGNTKEKAHQNAGKIIKNVERIWYLETVKNDGFKGKLLNLIGRKNINRWLKHTGKKNNFYQTEYVGSICTGEEQDVKLKEIIKRQYYQDKIEIEFEGHMLYAPKDYDYILTQWYGNYMELPPEEERVLHHPFQAWWI